MVGGAWMVVVSVSVGVVVVGGGGGGVFVVVAGGGGGGALERLVVVGGAGAVSFALAIICENIAETAENKFESHQLFIPPSHPRSMKYCKDSRVLDGVFVSTPFVVVGSMPTNVAVGKNPSTLRCFAARLW